MKKPSDTVTIHGNPRSIDFDDELGVVYGPMKPRILYVTRLVEFSAAHRLYREDMTEEQNRDLFGACANPFGHGHNYVCEATFRGVPDEKTGMVLHFQSMKRILQECVVAPLDHRHLNFDVPFFEGILPTSENLVVCLWDRLNEAIRGQTWTLHKLRLSSTARNWVEYAGE